MFGRSHSHLAIAPISSLPGLQGAFGGSGADGAISPRQKWLGAGRDPRSRHASGEIHGFECSLVWIQRRKISLNKTKTSAHAHKARNRHRAGIRQPLTTNAGPTPIALPSPPVVCGLFPSQSLGVCPRAHCVRRQRRGEGLAGHQCRHRSLCCCRLLRDHPLILGSRAPSSRHHGRSMENGLQGRGGDSGRHHRKPKWGTFAAALSHRGVTLCAGVPFLRSMHFDLPIPSCSLPGRSRLVYSDAEAMPQGFW